MSLSKEYRRSTGKVTIQQEIPMKEAAPGKEAPIKVNGFAQVLAMLRIADPVFRESILRRLSQKDPALVAQLRKQGAW
ncbi:MAG: hypothetical protein A2583_01020 [Bdellovibrionales bacterium RIFOXYD1_FULL_53_11]|nr:MAG: hypothetical protein A2583_01020 [Bdellovibrionales bacterium RIFOXYD1_FULL_53_11]